MTKQPHRLFIFGLGYTGQACARMLAASGWQVSGTVRSEAGAQRLAGMGFAAGLWDGLEQAEFPVGAHWLVTLPPDGDGCPLARQLAARGLCAADAALSVSYMSTTGVYGDLQGGWAWEWTPVKPASPRARARVLAEAQWHALAGDRLRLVRLPGIYGPGRSALDRIRDGSAQRIVKPGQVFSRVHVHDIATGMSALLNHPEACGVFHFCDDEPAPPQDVITFAAALMGVEPPPEIPFSQARLSPMAASFYSECKRVSNARARAVLGWCPVYPSYREGLAAIYAAEHEPGVILGAGP